MHKDIEEYIKRLDNAEVQLKQLPISRIDSEGLLLKEAFEIVYENRLFEFYDFNKELYDELKLKLFSRLNYYSGALSFLSIQILAAYSTIQKFDFAKKDFYLRKKCGIAINHLRSKKKVVIAKKCEKGFLLNGNLTWASGYKIFDELLIGFHYENKEYQAFANFKQAAGFMISEVAQTFVGESLNTTNIDLHDFFIHEDDIVISQEAGSFTNKKSQSKTIHLALYALGKAAIRNIENQMFKKVAKKRLKKIKEQILDLKNIDRLDELRIQLFNLNQKIITTAMVLDGGKSILSTKNLQRYYRELIMFNSNGLNENIKDLFLDDFIFYSR